MINVEKYQKYNYGFPAHDVDPKTKRGKEYCLAFARAFYSLYLRDELYTNYSQRRDEIFILRKYGVGDQAQDLYFQMCYGNNANGDIIRKGWMNVNWNILKIAVKYRNAFLGMFSKIDFDVTATSQDKFAKKEKEDKAYKLYIQKKLRPMLKQAGIEVPESEIPEPDSLAELEIYEQLGVFKNKAELAYEKFLKETFDTFSNWELETKRMIYEDFWDIGEACVKDYIDPLTQKLKVKYCDPANVIARKDHEGRILDGGVIEIKTIADVRAEMKNCGVDVSEDTLAKCAQNYAGYFGNPKEWFPDRDQELYRPNDMGIWRYDDWKVAVLDCEYRTEDNNYFKKVKGEDGDRFFKERFGKVYKNAQNKETIVKTRINYYRCKMVINSNQNDNGEELVYDYGEQYDIPRPDKSEAHTSFHYVKVPGPSPVKMCREIFDQVQLAWLKFQNAWAKARPDGYAYDETVLINSTIGGKLTPDEIVKMSEQTGRLFYKSVNKRNHPTLSPNAGNPIFPMPGGIGNALNEFVATWNLMINMLQELTGMTPQASASPLPSDTGKAVSEIQLAATSNVLEPVVNEYKRLKGSLAKTLLLRGQITFRHNENIAKDYIDVLGEETVELLKMSSKSAEQYGINLVPRTSGEIRAKLEQAALASLQAGRNGMPGLTLPQYTLLTSMITAGYNPKYIYAILAKMEQDTEMKQMQIQQANIQAQGQQQQQLAMVTNDATKDLEAFKSTLKINEETAKTTLQAMLEEHKTKLGTEQAMTTDAAFLMWQSLFQQLSGGGQQPTTPVQ